MRSIAHISDLHFGAVDTIVAEGLIADLQRLKLDLVAVSGDLTQRARSGQFRSASDYLKRIGGPQVVVPGNHDIPLYNVLARFAIPLRGYRRCISAELNPTYVDEELAVAGVNTARSNTWKDGRISLAQVERVRRFFDSRPSSATKILVAHHPFIPTIADPSAALVGGAQSALKVLDSCGCHLILSGHLHTAYAGDARPHHVEVARSILVVQAGTATSHRRRDEANAYNLLTIDGENLRLEVRAWNGSEFKARGADEYAYGPTGWTLRKT